LSSQRTISKHAVPRTSVQVRRRRYGDGRFLFRYTEIFALDDVTDAVWLACLDGLSVEAIAHRLVEREGLPLDEAVAATVATLARLDDLGLVDLGG
jgi:hypothetical protein